MLDSEVPFLRHEFLASLEASGCVSHATGWEPSHYVCRDNSGNVVAVAPQYLKHHSFGEYVFDWSWAEAFQRHGVPYYPKLIGAIPFTPCQSPRLMLGAARCFGADRQALVARNYLHQNKAICAGGGVSSWHVLFPDQEAPYENMLERIGVQYHWFNRAYRSFEEFLAQLVSRKRKSIKKERARIAQAGLGFEWCSGERVTDEQLQVFYRLYHSTYEKRGQQGYLNLAFFRYLLQDMPESLQFLFVRDGTSIVAGALFFTGTTTLYGRYWGCVEEYDALHFETCYYRGIEWCIEHGFTRFDAGAQGEHKLLRGFEPVQTRSFHHIEHPEFRQAIRDFLQQESRHIASYINEARSALPFKKDAQG